MTKVAIVGAEGRKFTPSTEAKAKDVIRKLLEPADAVLVSGHCHLGGIDIWAEEIAEEMGRPMVIFEPKELAWSTGYKPRNEQIAQECDVLYNITVRNYPPDWGSRPGEMRFEACYHCRNTSHVKSGGCWTAKRAQALGKKAYWYILGGNR